MYWLVSAMQRRRRDHVAAGPCARAYARVGVERVVVADGHAEVPAGRGAERLRRGVDASSCPAVHAGRRSAGSCVTSAHAGAALIPGYSAVGTTSSRNSGAQQAAADAPVDAGQGADEQPFADAGHPPVVAAARTRRSTRSSPAGPAGVEADRGAAGAGSRRTSTSACAARSPACRACCVCMSSAANPHMYSVFAGPDPGRVGQGVVAGPTGVDRSSGWREAMTSMRDEHARLVQPAHQDAAGAGVHAGAAEQLLPHAVVRGTRRGSPGVE